MNRKLIIVTFLVVFLLAACGSEEMSECSQPPEGFSSSSLVGTWGGTIDTAWDSTIVIREDGRYKQSMNIQRTGFKYESDWLPWRLEYSQQGVPYLHLEGMMLCGAYYYVIECTDKTALTGVGTNWYDACKQKWEYINNEGVFRISIGSAQRKTRLVPLTKSSDGPTGPSYTLRELNLLTSTPDP